MYKLQSYIDGQWLDINPENPVTGPSEQAVWQAARTWGYGGPDFRVVPVDSPEGLRGAEDTQAADSQARRVRDIGLNAQRRDTRES